MPERKLNILFLQDATDKSFDSVRLINRLFLSAISGEQYTHVLPEANLKQNEWANLLRQHDVILGFNKEALKVRAQEKISIPMLFPEYGLGVRGLLPLLEFKDLFAKGDGVVSPSSKDFESIDRHLKDAQLRRFMVPFCLPLDFINVDTKNMDRQQTLESLGLECDPADRYLLCVGRVNRQKNIHKLFPLVAQLNDSGVRTHLLVAGTEDRSDFLEMGIKTAGYEDEIRQRVQRDGKMRDYVHFLGHIATDQMPRLYHLADLNVTASTYRSEDFGFIPIEAMALGVPTLGTNWGGLRDTIREGITGYRMRVDFHTSALEVDVASGIVFAKELFNNPTLREQMRANIEKAVADYHPGKFSGRLLACLRELRDCKQEDFSLLDLPNLVSGPVLDFFKDIEEELAKGKTIFQARQDMFKKENFRYFKEFLGSYYL